MSKLVRYITEDGSAFVIAADSTDMIRKMEQIHQPSAAVTAGMGRRTCRQRHSRFRQQW